MEHKFVRLKSLHHVTFYVSDLDRTEDFAKDFGLHTVERTDSRLIMKTGGGDAFAYIAEKSENAKFIGMAFEVESEDDLQFAVDRFQSSNIRSLNTPGGGKATTLVDPNGFKIDLVHGISTVTPKEPYPELILNMPGNYQREGRFEPMRDNGPAKLFRIGHLALFVPSYAESLKWYTDTLGVIPSDVYHLPDDPEAMIVGFFRLDRGEELVDHHTLALMQSPAGQKDCHHISFETQDFEAQFMTHRYLESKNYELVWGVGRHPHGSHVFDVWRDPDRNRFETFSDTDRLRASDGSRVHNLQDVEMDVWSSDPPDRYFS